LLTNSAYNYSEFVDITALERKLHKIWPALNQFAILQAITNIQTSTQWPRVTTTAEDKLLTSAEQAAVYTQVTQLDAQHQLSEQWKNHHTPLFKLRFRLYFEQLNPVHL